MENSQKLITSNYTCLNIVIADIIISEIISFNLFQKPIFKNLLELARNFSKNYIPPNRNLIFKEVLDVMHEHKMKINLEIIKNEYEISGLLF